MFDDPIIPAHPPKIERERRLAQERRSVIESHQTAAGLTAVIAVSNLILIYGFGVKLWFVGPLALVAAAGIAIHLPFALRKVK